MLPSNDFFKKLFSAQNKSSKKLDVLLIFEFLWQYIFFQNLCSYNSNKKHLIFNNKKSHMKKVHSSYHFGNISTYSERPPSNFFKTGLIYPNNSKINKRFNFFDNFFAPKTVF